MVFDRNMNILGDGDMIVRTEPCVSIGIMFFLRDVSWFSQEGVVSMTGQVMSDGSVAVVDVPEGIILREFELAYSC